METTCGIFVINNNKQLLVVHPTNASWKSWSIPKGLWEEGESYDETAIREVYEETNIALDIGELRFVGELKYPKRSKMLHAFYYQLETDGSEYDLKCESTFIHKQTQEELPENNHIEWVDIEKAKTLIHSTQLELLNFLIHGK